LLKQAEFLHQLRSSRHAGHVHRSAELRQQHLVFERGVEASPGLLDVARSCLVVVANCTPFNKARTNFTPASWFFSAQGASVMYWRTSIAGAASPGATGRTANISIPAFICETQRLESRVRSVNAPQFSDCLDRRHHRANL